MEPVVFDPGTLALQPARYTASTIQNESRLVPINYYRQNTHPHLLCLQFYTPYRQPQKTQKE